MKFLIFTMVYNEGANLDRWVRFYGDQVGRESLAIIDHGSTDGSVDRQSGVAIVKVPRGALDEYQRAEMISQFQNHLQPNYNAIAFVDCDEFLVPEPRRYGSLFHYLVEFAMRPAACVRAVGLNIVHMPDREPPLDDALPILAQRDHVSFQSLYCKPAVVKEKATWSVGCHQTSLPCVVDPELYLFHLRDIDLQRSLARLSMTRGLEWAASNIEGQIGYHSRRSDADYAEAQFLAWQRQLDETGAERFEFAREIEQVNAEQPGDFRGRIAKIPKRFRELF